MFELTKSESPNCSTDAPQCYEDKSQFIGYVFFLFPLALTGVVLNIINIVVLCRPPFSTKSATVMVFRILATSDLATCVILTPIAFCRCINTDIAWLVSVRLFFEIYIFLPICNTFGTTSLCLILLIASERCISLRHTMFHRAHWTMFTAKVTSAIILFSSLAINLPLFFVLEIGDDNIIVYTEWARNNGYRIYSYIRMVLIKILPVISIFVVSVLSILALCPCTSNQRHKVRPFNEVVLWKNKVKIRVSIMVVAISCITLLSHMFEPLVHSHIYSSLFGLCPLSSLHMDLIVTINILETVSYASNFFFYCTFNRQFVVSLNRLCCKRNQRDTPIQHII